MLGVASGRGQACLFLWEGRDDERVESGQGIRSSRVEQTVGREVEAEGRRERGTTDGGKEPPGEYLDPIVYGVAAADGVFFVRTGTQLFRVGK